MQRLLSSQDIEEFRWLVEEHRGVNLTVSEAVEAAEQLLRVLYIVREVARKELPRGGRVAASVESGAPPGQQRLF